MGTITFLIFFPMIIAFVLLAARSDKARDMIVYISTAVIAGVSIVCAIQYFNSEGEFFPVHGESWDT